MPRLQKDSTIPSVASTSQEGQENRTLKVTLLSKEWKSSTDGELSTINRELAIQLAKHPNVDVSVLLPSCSREDRSSAKSHNVKLIEAQGVPGVEPVICLSSPPTNHTMHCVIGHGVHLGRLITLIKRNPNYYHCKWIQVVHSAPEEDGMYRNISEGQKKQETEIQLCQMADQVVTIGPKLAEAYKRYLRPSKQGENVFDLTPSIFSEFLEKEQATEERQTFYVLVIESGDSCEDFTVKGYDIAAKAIAELKDESYKLRFLCAPGGKGDEIAEQLLQHGVSRNQLRVHSFSGSREVLANLFCEVDLAIMPSRTDGFGITALEAISAGLPILVSSNSGLGQALKKVFFGSQCVVDSEDPKDWAREIKCVRQKGREVRLSESRSLRKKYMKKYSWEEPCRRLVNRMYELTFGLSESGTIIPISDKRPTPFVAADQPAKRLGEELIHSTHHELQGAEGPSVGHLPQSSMEYEQFSLSRVAASQNEPIDQRSFTQSQNRYPPSEHCQNPFAGASSTYCAGPEHQRSHPQGDKIDVGVEAEHLKPAKSKNPGTESVSEIREKFFYLVGERYFQTMNPQSQKEYDEFLDYLQKLGAIMTDVRYGSLVITVKCESLQSLEDLWKDYSSGHLDEVVQNCFVTEKILKELNLAELRLKTTMDIEKYNACKVYFEKVALRAHRRMLTETARFLAAIGEKIESSMPLEIQARGPEAVEAYNKALTEGKACIKRIPVMLIGQERTGKTSLKRSLKGEKFDKEEESTDGIETDPSYFKVSTEIWKCGQACERKQAEPEIPLEHPAAAKVTIGRLKKGESLLSGAGAELESDSESPNVSSTKSAHQVFHKTPRDTKASQRELPEELARLVEKLLGEGENANEDQIYSMLWDFGGQSVYYDTHPIFLTEKAIYILVCDLSRDPDEKAIPPVKTGLFENKVDIHFNITNLGCLDFWMSSIHSLVSPDVISSRETDPNVGHVLPQRLPPVFLVCTHADMPFGNSHAGDLARKMYGSLQRKTYQEHLYKDFFVVDNTKSGSGEECLEVLRLRKEVLAVAREMKLTKEDIPVKWLRYENRLRTNRDKCITLEEAKRIASSDCGIQEEDEFSTLLNFLHDQRIVIHFSGSPELEKMVILDPQWLVDVFKSIITVKRFKDTEHSVKDLWIQLEETGILDEKLIDHAWKELLDSQESRKSFLAIMERLSLLSPWSSSKGSKQYLVPSMLMSPPTDDVLKLLGLVKIPSLFVTFPSCQVPPGLFSRIILLFLQWCREEWKSNVNPQLFRNFAMFHIVPDKGISVLFLCHSSFIEVIVHSKDEHSTKEELTRTIHWKVRLLLERMRKEFYWLKNMKYEMCVCCPVCSNSRPGSVKCHAHKVNGCECLHFLSESDLRKSRHCSRPGRSIRGDCRIYVEQFACWFSVGDEHERSVLLNPRQADQASGGDEVFEKGRLSLEGTKDQELALPKDVINSLQCTENDAKDIVLHFVKALQLDSVSLGNPEPETKRLIRNLALKAKCENRYDLVNHLREITAAGITGPLLDESLPVVDMPFTKFKNLTFSLSVGDKWKLLAESLGLSNIDIAFLGERVMNPAAAVLEAVGKHRYLSVGEIYDTLVDHEMPVIADLM